MIRFILSFCPTQEFGQKSPQNLVMVNYGKDKLNITDLTDDDLEEISLRLTLSLTLREETNLLKTSKACRGEGGMLHLGVADCVGQ